MSSKKTAAKQARNTESAFLVEDLHSYLVKCAFLVEYQSSILGTVALFLIF
jgi:hypothetical protein